MKPKGYLVKILIWGVLTMPQVAKFGFDVFDAVIQGPGDRPSLQ